MEKLPQPPSRKLTQQKEKQRNFFCLPVLQSSSADHVIFFHTHIGVSNTKCYHDEFKGIHWKWIKMGDFLAVRSRHSWKIEGGTKGVKRTDEAHNGSVTSSSSSKDEMLTSKTKGL